MQPPSGPVQPSPSARGLTFECSLLFLGMATLYILLRSHHLTAVDGPPRAFSIYRSGGLLLHGNNHLLYPTWVFLWGRLMALLGFAVSGPIAFVHLTQAMNCVASAAIVTALYALVRTFFAPVIPALLLAIGYGMTRAFLLHATNAAEPIVGLFWATLALLLVSLCVRGRRLWGIAAGGALLALAMASYLSMVLMILPCVVLCVWNSTSDDIGWRSAAKRIVALFAGFASLFVPLFTFIYRLKGARTLRAMVSMLLEREGDSVYGRFSLAKVLNVVVGFTGNVVYSLPTDYGGIRLFLHAHGQGLTRAWWAAMTIALFVTLSFAAGKLFTGRAVLPGIHRGLIAASVTGVLAGLVLLAYWEPLYDKLWLMPLLLLFLALGCVLSNVPSRALRVSCVVLLAGCSIVNLYRAHQDSRGGWEYVDNARQIAGLVNPQDLVVTDYDSLGLIYETAFADPGQAFQFPTYASGEGARAVGELNARILATVRNHGSVYFLSILDQSEGEWDAFLGKRCGVPYQSFRYFRAQSMTSATIQEHGHTATLRKLVIDDDLAAKLPIASDQRYPYRASAAPESARTASFR